MPRLSPRSRIEALLALAGVRVNGAAPTDMMVHDEHFYARAVAHGSLGLGEAYMDGWWDAKDLDGMLFRLLNAYVDEQVHGVDDAALYLRAKLSNLQRGQRAYAVGEQHYDLGNDLFHAMLGRRLVYSCGYWKDVIDSGAEGLDRAQQAKLDLVCRKLGLAPGMRVLDIGCGWGEAIKYAAEKCGGQRVGINVTRGTVEYAT